MANTINWNAPTIKAGKISSKSGGGGSTATPNWTNMGRDIASIGQSIAAGMQVRQQNIRYEKEQQLKLLKERNDRNELLYDQVAQIDTLPNNVFEQSKNQMLYSLMDRYIAVKDAMDDPSSGLDPAVGRRALEEINATVAKYKQYAPTILAAASELKNALDKPFGTPGAIAGGVPTEQQKLLLSLIEGGDVKITDKDGVFYLYNDDKNGNVQNVFNVDEYMRVTKNGEEPFSYFREIINTEDEDKGAVALLGTAANPVGTYYDYETGTSADGKTEIRNLTWKTDKNVPVGLEAAIRNIAATGYNYLTADPEAKQDMEDLWNDVIGVDSKGVTGQDVVWDPQDKTKKTYQVKGYTNDQGQFVFDPKGNESQTYKDVFGNELKLTQDEFAKRWLAENAIHKYAPRPMAVSVSKKSDDDSGSYYEIDSAVSQLKPLISTGYFKGSQASFQLVDEGDPSTWYYAPLLTVPGQTSVYAPSQKFKINVYKTDKDGNVKKDKKGNPVIDYTGLRAGMGSKRKSQ